MTMWQTDEAMASNEVKYQSSQGANTIGTSKWLSALSINKKCQQQTDHK